MRCATWVYESTSLSCIYMKTNKSHFPLFIVLLLLDYIYCMLKVYKAGIC